MTDHVGISHDYHWRVTLDDGTVVDEETPEGVETPWGAFDLASVRIVALIPHRDDLPPVAVGVQPGQWVRVDRRTSVHVDWMTGEQFSDRITMVGVGPNEDDAIWVGAGPTGLIAVSWSKGDLT